MNYLSVPQLRLAAAAVRQGDVLAYPTEAVWGLGCDPFNASACEKILALKRRSVQKGLILVAADISQVEFLLEGLSDAHLAKLRHSWPGPNTWLIPHHGRVPFWVSGRYNSVAVRVSSHPVVQALCRAAGGPLISTSANPQGRTPARYAFQVRRYFGAELVYVPGRVDRAARPSVIRDLLSAEVIRE